MRQPLLWSTLIVMLCITAAPASEEPTALHKFDIALPGYEFSFPQDHGAHENFQTEWWYYSGQVHSSTGQTYGYQLTFFRRGLMNSTRMQQVNPSQWTISHLYFAHFSLSDITNHNFRYAEKVSRAGLGKAGAETNHLSVWIDGWNARVDGQIHYLSAQLRSSESGRALAEIDFELVPDSPPVIHGIGGVSKKGMQSGQASHYYSIPRLRTHGQLTVNKTLYQVEGTSWFDHEFGTNQLGQNQIGWDWFGLQLDDGSELMLYQLRRTNGTTDPASSGSLISPSGQKFHIASDEFSLRPLSTWTSLTSHAVYPINWHITLPRHRITLTVVPYLNAQELVTKESTRITYWEGAVRVHGQKADKPIHGRGYLEMTGYAEPLNERL